MAGSKMRARSVMLGGAAALITGASSILLAQAPLMEDRATTAICNIVSMRAAAPSDTTITSTERLQNPVPHCRVDGFVTTTNPGPNNNYFRLQLPDKEKWNNRFYFIALGGSAGYVPTESQYPVGNPIAAGFAVAGTDKGHQDTAVSGPWLNDPAKKLDAAHRGAHAVTVAAQMLTKAYYDVQQMYRYQSGCSGGGQMGLQSMMFHPGDYDGVLLGWPGGRLPDPRKTRVIDHAIYAREILREPGSWLSPAKRDFVSQKVLEACDMADGAKDETIWDGRLCKFNFDELKCTGEDGPNCLTQPEITSFKNILRDSYAPISNIAGWGYLGINPPPWKPGARGNPFSITLTKGWVTQYLNQPDRDLGRDPLTEDEMWTIMVGRGKNQDVGPYGPKPDLSGYERAGGKAIFFAGEGDIGSSNQANEAFMVDLAANMGQQRADKVARLYTVPNWGHCGEPGQGANGPIDGTDRMLAALIDWVEKGKVPMKIVTHRGEDRAQYIFGGRTPNAANASPNSAGYVPPAPKGPPRDYAICPFPLVSVFDKSKANIPGAVYQAENWSCRKRR